MNLDSTYHKANNNNKCVLTVTSVKIVPKSKYVKGSENKGYRVTVDTHMLEGHTGKFIKIQDIFYIRF